MIYRTLLLSAILFSSLIAAQPSSLAATNMLKVSSKSFNPSKELSRRHNCLILAEGTEVNSKYSSSASTINHLNSAQILMSNREWKQALLELKKCSECDANDSNCWTLMGVCYMQIGKLTEAKEAYQNATKLSKRADYIPISLSQNDIWTGLQAKKQDEQLRLSYMSDMRRLIKRNWHPGSTNFTNSVVVAFKISNNGKLSCANVQKSSGNAVCDKAAIDAINFTPTVGAFPADWGKEIDTSLTFDTCTLMSQ